MSEAPPIVHDVLRSSGEPLKPEAQDFFESRFGHDFSRVRIHEGSHAAEAAESVHATAFTVGRDIVFGAGRFAPHSPDGRRLIAHELSHVLQQGFEANSGSESLPVIPSSHALEHQAEHTARKALSSGLVETLQPSAPSIARQLGPPDAGVPDAGSTPDADAGGSAPPPTGGTPSPGPTPMPPAPAPAKPHQCAPGKGNPCPTAPAKTVVPTKCPEPVPTPGIVPPPAEASPALPVIPEGRFGADSVVTDFAEQLACCRAQREAAGEVEERFTKTKRDVGKVQDEQAKKDQEAAIAAAVEALKAEHPELTGTKLKAEVAKVTRQTKTQSSKEAASKKEAAIKAVTKQDVNAVQQDLAEKISNGLSDDYRQSMEEAIKEYGPLWKRQALAALKKEKDEESKKLTAKPKTKAKPAKPKTKGSAEGQEEPSPPSPAPLTSQQVDEQIEAALVRVRCEQQVWMANQLERFKRAWMVGRREQVEFLTVFPAIPQRQLKFGTDFKAPDVPEDERVPIPDSLKENIKETYPNVAPELVSFLKRLQALEPGVRASNYGSHGSLGFVESVTPPGARKPILKTKGFSVDLTLEEKDVSSLEARGFYPPDVAIRFLLNVDQASKLADAEWDVQYNDFRVAEEVNRRLGVRRIGFTGNIDKFGSLNWHGPAPLKLHFHLDYMPKMDKPDPEASKIRFAHRVTQLLESVGLGSAPAPPKQQGKAK